MAFKLYAISEAAQPTKIEILEENAVGATAGLPFGNPMYRLKFKARLQTADVPNQNGRIYPSETLKEVYDQLLPKVRDGKLLGEMDHPQVQTSDKNGQLKRSSTILLKNACVHFLEMTWDGQHIDSIVQTTTNRAGLDAYALIKDGVTVGFSLRAFGEIEKDGKYIKVIPQGLKAITYDFVANPSHSNALILEILNENTSPQELIKDLKQFEETFKVMAEKENLGLIEEAEIIDNTGKVCANGVCPLGPIEETIDYLTELALKSTKVKRIRLKI
jgi:hypothetical protein